MSMEALIILICFFSPCWAHLFWTTSSTTTGSCLQSTISLTLMLRCRSVASLHRAVFKSTIYTFSSHMHCPVAVYWSFSFCTDICISYSLYNLPTVSSDCCLPVYCVPCSHCGSRLVHRLKCLQVGLLIYLWCVKYLLPRVALREALAIS